MPGEERKKRTLIIEDDPQNTKLLKIVFSKLSTVETAADGKEGLKKLQEKYFDLIVSDVEVPYMNGIELFNEVRKKDADIGDRYLFFTGTANPQHLAFIEENALNYLKKPSLPSRLLEAVEIILKKS